jgi:hypothetical protein
LLTREAGDETTAANFAATFKSVAELVNKFAIARDKAAVLRQPFRKATRSIR